MNPHKSRDSRARTQGPNWNQDQQEVKHMTQHQQGTKKKDKTYIHRGTKRGRCKQSGKYTEGSGGEHYEDKTDLQNKTGNKDRRVENSTKPRK